MCRPFSVLDRQAATHDARPLLLGDVGVPLAQQLVHVPVRDESAVAVAACFCRVGAIANGRWQVAVQVVEPVREAAVVPMILICFGRQHRLKIFIQLVKCLGQTNTANNKEL